MKSRPWHYELIMVLLCCIVWGKNLQAQQSNKKNQLEVLLTANTFFEGKGMDWGVPQRIAEGSFGDYTIWSPWGLQYIRWLQSAHAARVSISRYNKLFLDDGSPRPYIYTFHRWYTLYSAGYQYSFVALKQADVSVLAEMNLRDGDEGFFIGSGHHRAEGLRLLDLGLTAGVRGERMLGKYLVLSLEAKYMHFLYLHDEVLLYAGSQRAPKQTFTLQLGVGARF